MLSLPHTRRLLPIANESNDIVLLDILEVLLYLQIASQDFLHKLDSQLGQTHGYCCNVVLISQGVVEFSLCLLFAKLVSYTFLYWLPLYISNVGKNPTSNTIVK